jgi:3-deoxy-D-manno-octulosonic-acid transferase
MFLIYQIVISILLIFSPIIILLRIFKNKEDKIRFVEKFSITTKKRSRGKLIWFHGASVGEILSVIPLIKYYEKNKFIDQILVTSSTLSSAKIIKKFEFKKTTHQFYPIDHFFFTAKFLKYWRPSLAIFVESEIWPCMFSLLEKNNVPLILLNARLTKKTFNRWMKIKDFSKSIFNKITIAYPQNFETNYYLKKIKTNRIKVIGNLKFIENDEKKQKYIDKKIKLKFKKKRIWVASSTHGVEEVFCAKAHLKLKKRIKNLITIIIPRHVHRSKKIISDLKKLNLKIESHSLNKSSLNNTDIYIVDTFGETKKFHKLGSSVFLGGSINKRGGQNPLEAARYGARILHGPNIDNFKDIYKFLKNLKVSKKITTSKELANLITFKKNKKIGVKINKIGAKILKKTIKELDSLINDELKKT